MRPSGPARAFSLVELVLVVVILGILGAIAVPRLSGLGSDADEVALAQNLAILSRAVEVYKAEHLGAPPTSRDQLTMYTDEAGTTKAAMGYPFIFGPYLHELPALPLGSNRGKRGLTSGGSPGDTRRRGVVDRLDDGRCARQRARQRPAERRQEGQRGRRVGPAQEVTRGPGRRRAL
jgi:prepilin-type N-terminal cleavage/methylation domain-containing protein